MDRFRDFLLTERFLNIFDKSEKQKFVDEVWNLFQIAYSKVPGGFLSFKSKEDLIKNSFFWKLVRKKNKIIAVAAYKDKKGRKRVAVGHDGTPQGKTAIKEIMTKDLERSFVEVSGGSEKFLMRQQQTIGKDFRIPNHLVSKILNKEILSLDSDGFHYTRNIKGQPFKKVLFGVVKKTF